MMDGFLDDTLEFKNNYLELFWQLPTQTNTHVELGLITAGGQLFHNTISVVDDGTELFHIGFGIQTDDHYIMSWDYLNGQITNFEWSGQTASAHRCRYRGEPRRRDVSQSVRISMSENQVLLNCSSTKLSQLPLSTPQVTPLKSMGMSQ